MIIDTPVMTTVECLCPLRGVVYMCPGGMMIGACMVVNREFQSTQESLGSMRGQSLYRAWLIEAELTEKGWTEIARL